MSCVNPITNQPYQIGDTGPATGIIFSTPGDTHLLYTPNSPWPISIQNNTNYYYEMGPKIEKAAAMWNTRNNSACGDQWMPIHKYFGADAGVSPPVVKYSGPISNGSEFGGSGSWIGTSVQFGDGYSNTIAIAALPSGGGTMPPNPVFDINSIASVLANGSLYGGFNDWFIPSIAELQVMLLEIGSLSGLPSSMQLPTFSGNIGNAVSSPGGIPYTYAASPWYRNEYWSSSESSGIGNPGDGGFSANWDGNFTRTKSTYKCHTRPVRAVRRFECIPTCSGCNCVDYNYRDAFCGGIPGAFCSYSTCGNIDFHVSPPIINLTPCTAPIYYSGGGTYGPPPFGAGQPGQISTSGSEDSTIGGDVIMFAINDLDVLGQTITLTDWQDDSEGYIITVWDADFDYLGKWKYDAWTGFGISSPAQIWGTTKSYVFLRGVTHLDGPYPMIDYSRHQCNGCGSITGAYFKIEMARTNNDSTYQFESACNNAWIGNMPSTQYSNWAISESAFMCGVVNHWPYTHQCMPWWATYDPTGCCLVYPTQSACNASAHSSGTPACNDGTNMNIIGTGGEGAQAKLSPEFVAWRGHAGRNQAYDVLSNTSGNAEVFLREQKQAEIQTPRQVNVKTSYTQDDNQEVIIETEKNIKTK